MVAAQKYTQGAGTRGAYWGLATMMLVRAGIGVVQEADLRETRLTQERADLLDGSGFAAPHGEVKKP